MVVVGEFSVNVETFALAETLPEYPQVRIEADRMVAHSPDWTLPCLWVTGEDLAAFHTVLGADPTVESIRATDRYDGTRLYHLEWNWEVIETVRTIIDKRGTILAAHARDTTWQFRIRFMEEEQLDVFRDHFAQEFTLDRLVTPVVPRQEEAKITPEQREALVLAADRGYFDVPRETTLSKLADDLGITHQSLSERLRRGEKALVTNTLQLGSTDDNFEL